MKILIVDDNILDRKYIRYLIENNFNVAADTAKDGYEALEKIKAGNYNLVITDIVMPRIEGVELIKQIKNISDSIEIIAMSGNNPYYLYILNKMGIKNTFTKPIDTDKFLTCVSALINISLKIVSHR
ncbi:MAG: response regulator [Bacteroidales bacterium]|nr:response regulator [Bacteroidales bacterium]MBN2820168.1 response regulator [Bacteroidales bacterium]